MVQDGPGTAFVTSRLKNFRQNGLFQPADGTGKQSILCSIEPDGKNALAPYGDPFKGPTPDIRPEMTSAKAGR